MVMPLRGGCLAPYTTLVLFTSLYVICLLDCLSHFSEQLMVPGSVL